MLRCQCKHKAVEHDPVTHACKRGNCRCDKFKSPWVCNCDHPWSDHYQEEVTMLYKPLTAQVDDSNDFSEINPWQDLKRGLDA